MAEEMPQPVTEEFYRINRGLGGPYAGPGCWRLTRTEDFTERR